MHWEWDGDVVLSYAYMDLSPAHHILTHLIHSKDYAISIATIHHLATVERRVAAVKVRFVEYPSHKLQ